MLLIFVNAIFYIPKATTSVHSILTPFSIKDSMRLATPSRVPLQDTSVFDSLLLSQDTSVNYLQTCKSQAGKTHGQPRGDGTPEPMEVDDDDSCQMWEEKCEQEKRKFKLIQFHKNYRPAYYGTWTKPRGIINPRNPFKMDNVSVSYPNLNCVNLVQVVGPQKVAVMLTWLCINYISQMHLSLLVLYSINSCDYSMSRHESHWQIILLASHW